MECRIYDLGMWPLTSSRNEGSHVAPMTKVWVSTEANFTNFCLFYNLTSYDLWPWYVTFDLINKWGFPCWSYDSSLVEIHQSMQNVKPLTLLCDLWPQEMRVPMWQLWLKFGSQLRPIWRFQPILQLTSYDLLTLVCNLWPHQQIMVPML